jgi:hypothetical protein
LIASGIERRNVASVSPSMSSALPKVSESPSLASLLSAALAASSP